MSQRIKKSEKLANIHIKESVWLIGTSVFHKGVAAVMTLFFTYLLTTREYGEYSVFSSWLNIISVIVTMNMYYGIYTQGIVKFEEDAERFSSALQGLTTILCAVWLFVYFVFKIYVDAFLKLDTARVLLMMATIWSASIFEFWSTKQRVNYRYKKLFCVVMLAAILQFVLCFWWIIISTNKPLGWIKGVAFSNLFIGVLLFAEQINREKRLYSSFYWKYALAFSIPLVPHYLSQIILNVSDRIMIGNMIGDEAAGIYSFAYHVAMVMTMIQGAMLNVVNPWIYRQIKENTVENTKYVAYGTMIIIAVGNLTIMAFAPEIVSIMAPYDYYSAIWIIPPVSMGCFFMYCYSLFADFSFYYNKMFNIMIASIIGAIANIVLNWFFIPIYGEIAAGYTTMISYLVYICMHYFMMSWICRENGIAIPYSINVISAIIIIFMAMGFSILFLYNFVTIRIIIIFATVLVMIVFRKRLLFLLSK